ncbi:MAG: MFS transporter [Candidatus Bathyarchaeota archaeon]|jgi:MFS family permease
MVPETRAEEEGGSLWSSNLGIMMISSGLWRIGGRMTWPFWALYVLQLGGRAFHIGLIAAVSSVFSLIPAFFGGYLADAVGRKKMVYSMSFLLAFNTILYLLAPSWEWLLLGRSLDAVFAGLRQPAFNALLADSTRSENRAMSYGMWQAIPPIFGLLSPYAIGILMDSMGVLPAQRLAYVVLLVFSTVGAFLRYRFLTETLPPDSVEKVSAFTIVKETLSDFKETAKVLPRQMWLLILMGILFMFGSSAGSIFMVTYATDDVIHLSSAEWGLINTASMLVSMLVSIPFAAMADRYGRLKIVLVSLFLTPLALLGFIYSTSFAPTFFYYVALTILGAMGGVASQALFIDFSPREHRGRISALMSVIGASGSFNFAMTGGGTLVGAFGNMIGGAIYDGVSYSLPLYIMAGMIGLTAIVGAALVREPKERED